MSRDVHIQRWVQWLPPSENCSGGLIENHFTTPWGTFCYTIMPFGLCNVSRTFQCLMNKVLKPFLGFFLRVFIDGFGINSDRTSHLTKVGLVIQRYDGSGVILSLKKTIIGFSKGKMVGHIVSKDGVATDPKKLDMISKLLFPPQRKPFKVF